MVTRSARSTSSSISIFRGQTPVRAVGFLLLAALLAAGDCSESPTTSGPRECVLDVDCDDGDICADGECRPSLLPTEGEGEGEEGEGEGEGEGEAPTGILTVLPGDDVEFGAVRLGAPVERTITLKNTGPVALTVLQIVLDDNSEGTFTVDPTGSVNEALEPGEELGVLLAFTPRTGSPDEAELKVLHTGAGQLTSVTLRAEFKGDSTISVTPSPTTLLPDTTTVDFGTVAIGDTRSITLFVRNDGDADSVLTVASATLTPATAGIALQAALSSPVPLSAWDGLCSALTDCPASAAACTAGACVDADGHVIDSVPLTLTFSPQQAQAVTATLTIRTDVGGIADSAYEVTVSGIGAAGVLSVTPSPVSFDEVFVGFPERQTVLVKNAGGAPLTLTGATLETAGSIFALEELPTFPINMAPGDEIPVEVVCTPTRNSSVFNEINWSIAGAAQSATTRVEANTRQPPELALYDETLVKLALPAANPSAPVVFSDVYVGRTATRTFKLVNDGAPSSELKVRRTSIEGPAAERFSVMTNATSSTLPRNLDLAPAAGLTINYQPQALTGFDDTATLLIESDDPARPLVELQLTGRGIRPVINVSTTSLDFGRVLANGTPATRTFTVTNGGAGPLVVTSITPPGQAVFSVASTNPPLPATLVPLVVNSSAVLTVTVRYAPIVSDVISESSLAVQSTDFDRGPVTVALVGTSGGCPARANATVVVTNDQCTYTCNGGFHACGDACLANNSPDSCGTSCTPCQLRNNAVRGCTEATSTCTYTCETDARDLNSNLGVPQSTSSDGCEYQCPVFPTATESCTALDEDCDGLVDEGLNADQFDRNSTASTPSTTKNTNDTCAAADAFPTEIVEGSSNTINATIYPMPSLGTGNNDEDWYRVVVKEGGAGGCITGGLTEPYRTTVELTGIPAGSDYDLEVFQDNCSTSVGSSVRSGNADDVVNHRWDGVCCFGFVCGDDVFTYRVRVFRFQGGSCDDYQLKVTLTRL
jgi:hypothetical protein